MLSKKPGLVVRIHGKDHEEVDVDYGGETVKVNNMLKHIKVGDYVIVNDGLVIEILTEHEAEKRMKQI